MDISDGTITGPPGQDRQALPPPAEADAGGSGSDSGAPIDLGGPRETPIHPRAMAMILAGRYHGIELDPAEYRLPVGETEPTAASLSAWAQNSGMWSRAVRLRWRHLMHFNNTGPVVLLFTDGTAGLLTGINLEHNVVFLKDPRGPAAENPVPVDEMRLNEVWSGEAILLRANRGQTEADAPFSFRWLVGVVGKERKSLRDIGIASFTLSMLTIFPPFLVMTVVDKVLTHHSYSTLILLSTILAIAVTYETILGYVRRLIIVIVGVRIDAKLSLHVFSRLVRLPLDYFERHPAGETMYNITQINRVREFITGKLLTTFLDLITLCVLLPFLFYLNATLAWMVVVCACIISLIIIAYLRPLRVVFKRVVEAETRKHSALAETIYGMKTVKALALEPQRKTLWDEVVADAGKWRIAFGKLANWPQTLVTPIERFMWMGVIMVGAYLAMTDTQGYMIGSLFAFMMLSQRVAQPLVGLARLIEDYEEVGAAVGQAASVLNRPLEVDAASGGLRPKFAGAITFDDVTFTYAGTKTPALDRVTFSIPAGTMLGLVGPVGFRQVHDHPPAAGHQPRLHRLCEDRQRRPAGDQPAPPALQLRRRAAGQLPVPRLDPRQHPRRPSRPDAGRRGARRPAGRCGGVHRAHAERLRDLHRGRLAEPLRRPAPTPRDRPRADHRSAHPDPRRGHQRARPGERGAGQRQPAAHRARPDHGDRLPPPVVAHRMRPDHGAGKGQGHGRRPAPHVARALPGVSPALGTADSLHG